MQSSDSIDEILRRIQLKRDIEKKPKLIAIERELCSRDIFHFIKNWCWTFDPREDDSHIPFLLYDYQIEALKWLDSRFDAQEDGLIEKSRDMGVTWLLVVWSVHRWLFGSGFTCLFGSKSENDVDNASIDSIFGKIRYLLYKLPPFLRPDMSLKINEKRDSDSHLSIVNPVNGNELSGGSANANFGRSGRRSVVFLDEFAFVEHSDSIWSAVSGVSNVKIPVSTPNGKGNMFYSLRSKGALPILSLHWSRHPNKDNNWYESKKKTMEAHQIAQELDIDYSSSKSGRVYKRFEKRFHVASKIIYPNEHFEHFISWDFGIADSMCLVFGQIDFEDSVSIYACYDLTDQDIEYFIPLTKGELPDRVYFEFLNDKERERVKNLLVKVFISKESCGFFLNDFTHYGDFAGTQRSANSRRSVRDRLKSKGIDLICSSRQDFANRIQCFDNLLKLRENKSTGELTPRFIISPDCDRLIDAVMNYIWDKEDVDNPNLKPRHDWASHYCSALEFLAINRFPIKSQGKVTTEVVR